MTLPETSKANPRGAVDRLDNILLNLLQDGFPVSPRPYHALSERLSQAHGIILSEDEVLARTSALRDSGRLRRLGAILNPGALGYNSTLCAASVPPHLLETVASLISQRPEVTHNYIRDHRFNVWFTFCHHDKSRLGAFLEELGGIEGLGPVMRLPARKVYKIKAVFNLPVAQE